MAKGAFELVLGLGGPNKDTVAEAAASMGISTMARIKIGWDPWYYFSFHGPAGSSAALRKRLQADGHTVRASRPKHSFVSKHIDTPRANWMRDVGSSHGG